MILYYNLWRNLKTNNLLVCKMGVKLNHLQSILPFTEAIRLLRPYAYFVLNTYWMSHVGRGGTH